MRTLVIASAASASAAAVTSQLWIAGTWLAAAITPVLVALVSEALHRPTEKIVRTWTSDRPEAAPSRRWGDQPAAGTPPAPRPSNGSDPPVRIYRQPSAAAPRRGKIALRVVAVTAALAFGIAVVTITAGELIAGESIGKGERRTTFVPGSATNDEADKRDEPAATDGRPQTTTDRIETETTPVPDPSQPTETTTPTPVPSQPAPPAGTPTETTPAP